MHNEIRVDLKQYDHIPDKSCYNHNYYMVKAEYSENVISEEILIDCDEYENTVRIYTVSKDGIETFLFCDCSYSDYNEPDVYSGILYDDWI